MNRFLPLLLSLAVLVLAAPAGAATEPTGVWPLSPRPAVVRPFDPPDVVWGSGHRGVDLRGTVGQPVRSALSGRVSFVGRIAGTGVVVVDHGATRTTYQPVAAGVRLGTNVAAGDVVGTLEWSGSHCLPAACLHWGLVRGETYLDPLTLVGGPSPVRLLPLGAAGAGTRSRLPLLGGPIPSRTSTPSVVPGTAWSLLAALVPWS